MAYVYLLFACSSDSQEVNKTGTFGETITIDGAITPTDLTAAWKAKPKLKK